MKAIVYTGGGSGGHISPIIAISYYLKKKGNIQMSWIGHSHFERDAASDLKVYFYKITSGKLRRYFSFKNITDVFKILFGTFQSIIYLLKNRPLIIISTGGFVSVPVILAGKLLRIPIIIHEQTIGLGLANKICSYFAKRILVSFEQTLSYLPKAAQKRAVIVGNPIRPTLLTGSFSDAKLLFNCDFSRNKPVLYITGGGQGAVVINKIVWELLKDLTDIFYVIHQTGKANYVDSLEYRQIFSDYFPLDFIKNELASVYAITDVLVGRSGAGTVNEVSYFAINSLFIPLQNAQNNEQYKNAKWCIESGIIDGIIIEEGSLSKEKFMASVLSLVPSSVKRFRGNDLNLRDDKSVLNFIKEINYFIGD